MFMYALICIAYVVKSNTKMHFVWLIFRKNKTKLFPILGMEILTFLNWSLQICFWNIDLILLLTLKCYWWWSNRYIFVDDDHVLFQILTFVFKHCINCFVSIIIGEISDTRVISDRYFRKKAEIAGSYFYCKYWHLFWFTTRLKHNNT